VDRLIFPAKLRQELIAHALEGAPHEVCGVVAGREGRVERVFRVRNIANTIGADEHVFRDRQTDAPAAGQLEMDYYMDPLEYGRVEDEVDASGLEVLGYYHSHPRSEARPSPRDIRLARWLDYLYVLVSLQHQQHPEVRAWRILKSSEMAEEGEAVEVPLA
jgi:proteasome lid subunit RPN8/RPN11